MSDILTSENVWFSSSAQLEPVSEEAGLVLGHWDTGDVTPESRTPGPDLIAATRQNCFALPMCKNAINAPRRPILCKSSTLLDIKAV